MNTLFTSPDGTKILEYSEYSIVVITSSEAIENKLRELGGKRNKFLSCGTGWIFRNYDLDRVIKALTPTT